MKEISIKKATLINGMAKYSVIIMNIVFSAVLARILSPEDYGIIAIVTIFTTLFLQISDMGFGTAVIQYKTLNQDEIDSIYTFTFWIALLLGGIFCVLGFPIATFYQDMIYRKICVILSISVFFNCLNMVPNAVLLRDKKFILVGMRTITVNFLGYIIALLLALAGGKFYSLIFQSVIAAILNFIWNNYTVKLKLKLFFSMRAIKKVWKYSVFQFMFSWINYLEVNLDNLLIGSTMGSIELAYYDKGYKLICYPMSSISGIITPVLHPILKDYQDDKSYLLKRYKEVQRLLSVLGIIIATIFFCASNEIINIMYGSKWSTVTLSFQLLSISIYPKIMMATTGALYCSAGNTKMLFKAGTINAIVTSLAIIIGVLGGDICTVALGVSIANWSNMLVTFYLLIFKVLEGSFFMYLKELLPDLCMMLITNIVIYILFSKLNINRILISFFLKVLFICFIYMGYLIISGKIKTILALLPKKNR